MAKKQIKIFFSFRKHDSCRAKLQSRPNVATSCDDALLGSAAEYTTADNKASATPCMLLLYLFRGIIALRNTMELQKLGIFPGPGPEVAERQKVFKE